MLGHRLEGTKSLVDVSHGDVSFNKLSAIHPADLPFSIFIDACVDRVTGH